VITLRNLRTSALFASIAASFLRMISWIAAGVMVFGFAIALRKINEMKREDLQETFSHSQLAC
jgi:hypothetical protein